ncbi:MAG: ATP-binding cassette domain-containing protein [Pirellulaceae bacterium]
MASTTPGAHRKINGIEHINKVIQVDQSPLGNSPTSNPATYTGAFELIRNLFAELPESKIRGFTSRRFSFNVPGGRCENCSGNGQICIEMHFLPDVWVECQACKGQRYNEETLTVKYHGRNIHEVLEMSCGEALRLFDNIPKIKRILKTLCDVGLDYVKLGQSAPTLSGGEAQRVKLAAELARPDTGRTLYILDEPTTGLHFDDLAKLLEVIQRLVDIGNSVVLIEHNLDIIKAADWVIEMGPEAGHGGGQVVVAGTPETMVEYAGRAKRSKDLLRCWTGEAMEPVLKSDPYEVRKAYDPLEDRDEEGIEIEDLGRDAQMPWESDGRKWHTGPHVGHNGETVKWDGRILEEIVDRIEQHSEFSPTVWNNRTVVEINGEKAANGWFFHALTAEEWLLKLKFRVRRGTFKRNELTESIPLKTANEMENLPIYGNQSRIKTSMVKGWQEIEIKLHSYDEIDIPEFWKFVDDAISGFLSRTERIENNVETLTPWATLGRKWHMMHKGFQGTQVPHWSFDVLEKLEEVVKEVAEAVEFDWTGKQVVHGKLNGTKNWVSLLTKRAEAVWLQFNAPVGKYPKGRLVDIAPYQEVLAANDDTDIVKVGFNDVSQVEQDELSKLLQEHLDDAKEG